MNTSDVVWAKMRLCSYWPAIMVKDPPPEIEEKGRPGQICVLFFGTKKYGYVNSDMVVNYSEYREKYSAKNTRGLKNAVDKCDEYLADPTNFSHHVNVDLTSGTVSLQTPMQFPIKKEPGVEENFCLEEEIKINTQPGRNTTQHYEETGNRQDSNPSEYEKRVLNIEKQLQTNSEKTERDTTELKSLITSLTGRYDKELDELKKLINDVTLRYDGSQVADKIPGKCTETAKVGTYQNGIRVLETKLREKTDEYTKLSELVEQIKEASSKKELYLQNQIQGLNNKLIVKNSLYESLLFAKQTAEKEVEQKFEKDYALKISVLTENLSAMTKKHDDLLVANQTASKKLMDLSSQHESMLKELSDQNTKTILDLKNKLIEKDALCEQLSLAKKNIEDENKPKMAKVLKIQEPNDKLHEKVTQLMKENNKDELGEESTKKAVKRKLIRSPTVGSSPKKLFRTSKQMTGLNKSRQKQFVVERIVQHETDDNQTTFRIRWKGYGEDDDSWLPESDLFCPDILKEYKKNHNLI